MDLIKLTVLAKLLWVPVFWLMANTVVVAETTSKSQVSEKHSRFYVVAVQAPPLLFPRKLIPSSSLSRAMPIRDSGTAVIESVIVKIDLPETPESEEDFLRRLESVLLSDGVWSPSLMVAIEACTQLRVGLDVDCELHPQVQPIVEGGDVYDYREGRRKGPIVPWAFNPLFDYGPDLYRAAKDWYSLKQSNVDYANILDGQESVEVIEVGILNYEVVFGRELFLQVMMKRIDPASGSVIARARKAAHGEIDNPKSLLENKATLFKEQFEKTARKSVRRTLDKIGLVSK